jgi:thiol-disulfide isomerase/thioredoxin
MATFARRSVMCLLVVSLLSWGGCKKTEPDSVAPQKSAADQADQPTEGQPLGAQGILEKMAAAYQKASSYTDAGVIRVVADTAKQKIDQRRDFSTTFARPNKLRVASYQGMLVSDGRQWCASIQGMSGQVVKRDAPAKVTLKQVLADRVLTEAMTPEFAAPPLPLVLLLADDPLKVLFDGARETTLQEPGKLDDRDCYRVRVRWEDDFATFWIDQGSYVLRQIVLPSTALRRALEAEGDTVKSISVLAEFSGAQLNSDIDPKVFEFQTPADVEQVKFFLPPDPAQLLGKKTPGCKFVDLQGKPVTLESMAGKVVVLEFWATWCEPCRTTLPELEKVYQKYKDNPKVAFLAVSVDQPETDNTAVAEASQKLGVSLPTARDPEQHAGKLLKVMPIPVTMIIGADGVLQEREMGVVPDLATLLAQKIEKVLAGQDIYRESLATYQQSRQMLEDAAEGRLPDEPKPGDQPGAESKLALPEVKIAARSEPKTFKLQPLWKCSEVKTPGNVLVVPQQNGPPRLVVLDAWKAVAEVGMDGKQIATHTFGIQPEEAICNLRTAQSADGKRVFVGFAAGQQRLHLFDADWKLLASYPDDALTNRHKGISDVQLGDLDGEGKLKLYIGYWDVVGIQGVSLEGKRLWSNRSFASVLSMAVGSPDAQGQRNLVCTSSAGSLAVLDAKGQRQAEIKVPDRMLALIAAADLKGDGQLQWCSLAPRKLGDNTFIGLDSKGAELWSVTLAEGVPQQPIERIIPGRLIAGGPAQWLLPGCDGTIHVVSADGKPLDMFHYGATLGGLATAAWDGQTVLIVSSTNGLEAWRVER